MPIKGNVRFINLATTRARNLQTHEMCLERFEFEFKISKRFYGILFESTCRAVAAITCTIIYIWYNRLFFFSPTRFFFQIFNGWGGKSSVQYFTCAFVFVSTQNMIFKTDTEILRLEISTKRNLLFSAHIYNMERKSFSRRMHFLCLTCQLHNSGKLNDFQLRNFLAPNYSRCALKCISNNISLK